MIAGQKMLFSGLFLLLISLSLQAAETAPSLAIRVYLSGEVKKVGSYNVPSAMAFIAAITEAGGLGDFANSRKIKILRPSPNSSGGFTMKLVATVDYNLIIDGQASLPEMKDGDVISVPQRIINFEEAKTDKK